MKTEYPGVEWLLDCEPRVVQLEALARSYTGFAYRDHKEDEPHKMPLIHAGRPASGWGHMLEMRLGKTPTLLNEFMLFRRDFGLKKAFVLAPNKYCATWALEAQTFGVDVPLHRFLSGKKGRKEFELFAAKNPEFMVFVNYEALIQKENNALFEDVIDDRTYMGADESVFLKNRNSQIFTNAFDLSKDAAVTRPMTGKPTPQGVQDLYSQLRFARKLDGKNFFQFRNTFAVMGGFKGKKVVGVKNEDRLQRLARDSYFFARRKDWGTSIDSNYETVNLPMTEAQKRCYREMEEDFVTWLDSGEAVSADQIITKHLKLQQISSGFIYDEDRKTHYICPFEKTPKYMELIDRIENYVNGKIIVIAHFSPTMDALYEHLQKYKPAVIRGGVFMKKAGLDVDAEKLRFNNDRRCRVMLGQSKAIKYGHTLMGTPDDPCVATAYFENSYSLDDRAQSEERNQGEGQTGAIHVMDFASSPVERRVIEALQRKEEIASVIMGYYKGDQR